MYCFFKFKNVLGNFNDYNFEIKIHVNPAEGDLRNFGNDLL